MADVTFNVPGMHKGKPRTMERKGRIAWFVIGGRRIKFVLQVDDAGNIDCLTHYASGMIVGQITPIKIRYAARGAMYPVPSDRDCAEELITERVNHFGADVVLRRLDDAPVLNS